MADTAELRSAGLDPTAFGRWAGAALGRPGPWELVPVGAGHSNLTFRASDPVGSVVVRRPPAGPLLPTAHDVVREHRVLALLAAAGARVPPVIGVYEAPDLVGAPFFVMADLPGDVIRRELPAWLGEDQRRALGQDVITTLVEVHTLDPGPLLEARLGRPTGYLERQLTRWAAQREGIRSAVAAAGGRARDLDDYEVVRDWLLRHRPREQPAAVVHGDYKLDNLLVDRDTATVTAVLDWEMATVGDPRADLGYLLWFWPEADEADPLGLAPTGAPGFPSRADLTSAWEQGTGRTAQHLSWFVVLAGWKLAILLEASYHRYLAGTTDDPFFATLDEGVPMLLARARNLCHD